MFKRISEKEDALLKTEPKPEKRRSGTTVQVLKACLMCCYLLCPPTPNSITRKMAFHPPRKGKNYTVHLAEDPNEQIDNASKLIGKRFLIKPAQLIKSPHSDYNEVMRHIECFALRTALGSCIIVVRCTLPKSNPNGKKEEVVIFCQPNASDLGEYLQPCCANIPLMAELFDTDVYAFDYSGYGYSSGKPSEANIYADVRAVYEFVRKTRPDKKIVLLGFSLGTATVSDMAASRPEGLAGVVLVAPFTSGLRLIGDQPEKPTTCTLDRFNTYEKVGKIVVPLLVCHGNQDETIEVEHGLELARLAQRAVPPLIIDEANHITIFNGKYMQTFTRIRRFLDEEINQSQERETNANIHDSAQEKMIM